MKTFFIISANNFSVNTISISLFHNILCLFFIEQTGAWNPLLMPIDLFKNASCDKINIHFYVNSQESVPLGDGRKVRNNLPRSWLYGAYFYFNNLRPAGNVTEKLKSFDIPSIIEYSSYEEEPLGRVESVSYTHLEKQVLQWLHRLCQVPEHFYWKKIQILDRRRLS